MQPGTFATSISGSMQQEQKGACPLRRWHSRGCTALRRVICVKFILCWIVAFTDLRVPVHRWCLWRWFAALWRTYLSWGQRLKWEICWRFAPPQGLGSGRSVGRTTATVAVASFGLAPQQQIALSLHAGEAGVSSTSAPSNPATSAAQVVSDFAQASTAVGKVSPQRTVKAN